MRFTNPFGKLGRSSGSRRIKHVKPPDQFEGRTVYLTLEEWDRHVMELVDSLPRFGQDIPPPPGWRLDALEEQKGAALHPDADVTSQAT